MGGGGGGGVTWVNFGWVCAAGLSKPRSHYSPYCGDIIDPIIVTFGKKQFSQSQLSNFLLMHLPSTAFRLEHPNMICHIFVKPGVV